MGLHVVLIGLGQVGTHIAKVLSAENHDVFAIESNKVLCQQAQNYLDIQIIHGDGTDHRVLETAGIQNADMTIALSGQDEQNIVTCQLAMKYGVRQKIARIRNRSYYEKIPEFSMQDWGVDVAIQPEIETAKQIALLINRGSATEVLEFAGKRLQVIGIRLDASCPVLSKTLRSVSQEYPEHTFRVVAILRHNKTIIPYGNETYQKNDHVFFIARTEEIPDIVSLLGRPDIKLQNIMILGGGQIGRAVSHILENDKTIEIKLIESNPDKTLVLADKLKRTLILEGDGRDFDMLLSEGILVTDAFVSVTETEKTNIMTSLVAKQSGVKKTIALINRPEYIPIMGQIGIDASVNTNIITSNTILGLIRRGNIVSVATLPLIDAEITEYYVPSGAGITKKPLSKIKFPNNAILGAIHRADTVFIPVGDTQIQAEDRVVTFCLPDSIDQVAKFFFN